MIKHKLLLSIFLVICQTAWAQETNPENEAISVLNIDAHGGAYNTAADFAERFGLFGSIGAGLTYKTDKNHMLGFHASFIFSQNVREDSILKQLQTSNGFFIGIDGLLYRPILNLRGVDFRFNYQKILPILDVNPNSGLTIGLSAGILQHRVHLQLEEPKKVPYLFGVYKKGYDRLTNGYSVSQYVGYTYFSTSQFINFSIGLEITEAFTKNKRSFNFDTEVQDTDSRLDIFYGLVAKWRIPLYNNAQY